MRKSESNERSVIGIHLRSHIPSGLDFEDAEPLDSVDSFSGTEAGMFLAPGSWPFKLSYLWLTIDIRLEQACGLEMWSSYLFDTAYISNA